MISLPTAKSVFLYPPNEFALFAFRVPIRVSRLIYGGCCFRKCNDIRNTVCDVDADSPAGRGAGELCVQHTQPPLLKSLHLPPQQAVCVGKAITLPSSHTAQTFKGDWASLPFSNITSAWGPSASSSCFCFMFYVRAFTLRPVCSRAVCGRADCTHV